MSPPHKAQCIGSKGEIQSPQRPVLGLRPNCRAACAQTGLCAHGVARAPDERLDSSLLRVPRILAATACAAHAEHHEHDHPHRDKHEVSLRHWSGVTATVLPSSHFRSSPLESTAPPRVRSPWRTSRCTRRSLSLSWTHSVCIALGPRRTRLSRPQWPRVPCLTVPRPTSGSSYVAAAAMHACGAPLRGEASSRMSS